MTEKFTDSELKQLHNFIDSSIMYEVSRCEVINMPELSETQLEKIVVPENIKVPINPSCKCVLE